VRSFLKYDQVVVVWERRLTRLGAIAFWVAMALGSIEEGEKEVKVDNIKFRANI
jgi:hypothetical protein